MSPDTDHDRQGPEGPPEQAESLWSIISGPLVWAGHFLASYVTVAIWCEKVVAEGGSLLPARLAVGGYTLIALAVIGFFGLRGFVRHSFGSATVPHDFDTAADRHRFLGFATLLLSGLSFVAVIYAGMAAAIIGTCQG